MSSDSRVGVVEDQVWHASKSRIDDRQGLLGLLALISLAGPALLIRYLFPELNPLFLAAFGVAIYSLYLGLLVLAVSRHTGDDEVAVNLAPITVDEHED